MKYDRFDYTVWALLALLALALGGLVLRGDRVGARVVRTYPAEGQSVSALGPIGIEFAQPMQAGSVTERFSLEPAVPGELRWSGQLLRFVPAQPLRPGQRYTARLASGAVSVHGRPLQSELAWTFAVRQPAVAFLGPVSTGAMEVWRQKLDTPGLAPEQLTHTGGRVFDYAASPDGEQLVFSAVNEQGGLDLWLVNLGVPEDQAVVFAACGADRCSSPAWSPDGTRLAYTREEVGLAPGLPHGPPRVWTATLATGATTPLYQDSQVLGFSPVWSPDGRRLAQFDGGAGGIRIVDLESRSEQFLPTWTGVVGSFSPDSRQMVYTQVAVNDDQTQTAVLQVDLDTGQVISEFVAPPDWSDMGVPAWSPAGDWLAMSVRSTATGAGRHLRLVRPDWSATLDGPQDPAFTYGPYRWDPWGSALLAMRIPLGAPYPRPEIVVWTLDDQPVRVVAADATAAQWLP